MINNEKLKLVYSCASVDIRMDFKRSNKIIQLRGLSASRIT